MRAACGVPSIVWFGELCPRRGGGPTAALGRGDAGGGHQRRSVSGGGPAEVRDRADVIEVNPEETALSRRATWAIREPRGRRA